MMGFARMNFASWNWDKIDELVASFARPYQMYLCSTAVAASTVILALKNGDPISVGAALAACTTIATGTAYFRSVDKKTAATAEMAKNKPSPDVTVTGEIK